MSKNTKIETDSDADPKAQGDPSGESVLGAPPCSTHVLFKVRWAISGFCSAEPVAAFTSRKLANAEARRKNEAATTCEYVVKTLKIIR